MRSILRVIDSISEGAGRTVRWCVIALIVLMCFEVIARYVFNAPTHWSYELASMLGVTIAFIGWSYTLRHHGHVRVDVFYTRLSPRGKAIIDVLGTLLLFFPLLGVLLYISVDWAWYSWSVKEIMTKTNWYPPAYPIRTVMVVGLCLLFLQSVAEFIRDLHVLIRNKAYD